MDPTANSNVMTSPSGVPVSPVAVLGLSWLPRPSRIESDRADSTWYVTAKMLLMAAPSLLLRGYLGNERMKNMSFRMFSNSSCGLLLPRAFACVQQAQAI